jgi:hypothetical protein
VNVCQGFSVVSCRATLKKIQENPLAETEVAEKQHTVAGHVAFCLEYDVSRKQVSIHIPLTRLLAALHLHLYKFELDFHSPELDFSPRPTIIQVLEPVLRQQALIAQVTWHQHVALQCILTICTLGPRQHVAPQRHEPAQSAAVVCQLQVP